MEEVETNDDNVENISDFDKTKEEFKNLIKDFLTDLISTFPELKDKIDESLLNEDASDEVLLKYYNHITAVFPERFFDILYQNADIFEDADINVIFLPK